MRQETGDRRREPGYRRQEAGERRQEMESGGGRCEKRDERWETGDRQWGMGDERRWTRDRRQEMRDGRWGLCPSKALNNLWLSNWTPFPLPPTAVWYFQFHLLSPPPSRQFLPFPPNSYFNYMNISAAPAFCYAVLNSLFQGWEFSPSLIAHLLICTFCSNQISHHERFAQIAQDK